MLETLYFRHEIMCCGSLREKMSTAIRLLTVVLNCVAVVKATFNCPISLVCSKCGKHISLHLFVPVSE